jgi:hypothetical protein
MNEPISDYDYPAGPMNRFQPWRDDYGRVHDDIPRCCGHAMRRGSFVRYADQCHRKGVVQRGAFDPAVGRGERWYCLQHDPKRADERKIEKSAPILIDLLREAVELMPRTKKSEDWIRRATRLTERKP